MPIYKAICRKCGERKDYYQTIADCHKTPDCCGETTEKIISAPMLITEIPSYQSPVDGRVINSRTQRREDLKRTGCRPWEGREQENKEAAKHKQYEEKKEDAKLHDSVAKAFYSLDHDKQKLLAS